VCSAARRLEAEALRLRDLVAELTSQCEQTRALEESNARYSNRLLELEPLASNVPKLNDIIKQLREQLAALQVVAAERTAALAAHDAEMGRLQSEHSSWLQERVQLSMQVQEAEARADAAEKLIARAERKEAASDEPST
jgi:peptidoglycan hydrolase CwlO-like protein